MQTIRKFPLRVSPEPQTIAFPDCVVRATPVHVFQVNPRSIPPSPQ
jgi:hypothetical protein